MRSHCRPKTRRREPTTSRSASIGMTVSAGPRAPTIAASTTVAAATPVSDERQPRATPEARTIVSASTNSTALARKAERTRKPAVMPRGTVAHGSAGPCAPGCQPAARAGRSIHEREAHPDRAVRGPRLLVSPAPLARRGALRQAAARRLDRARRPRRRGFGARRRGDVPLPAHAPERRRGGAPVPTPTGSSSSPTRAAPPTGSRTRSHPTSAPALSTCTSSHPSCRRRSTT